jgi:hypothetical protein
MNLSTTSSAWKYSYRMGADIDLSNMAFTPIGNATTPYHGTFDGAGHIVSNLHLQVAGQTPVGLFGAVIGPAAEIRSVGVVSATVVGSGNVGILVGQLDRARVINCYSSGTVMGDNNVGGLVGSGSVGVVISTSHSSASVTGTTGGIGGLAGSESEGSLVANSYATGAVVGGHNEIGGLLGSSHASIVVNSYATGDVTSAASDADLVGGLIGRSCAFAQLSFATGNVTVPNNNSAQFVDRLDGYLCGSAWLNKDYVLAGSTCQSAHGACPAPSGDEMGVASIAALQDRTSQPLASWDFTNVWTASSSQGFPTITAPVLFDANTWDGCAAHSTDPHSAGGNGTPEQPLLICTATQFTNLGGDNPWWAGTNGVDAVEYVRQMADIDFMGGMVQPIGTNVNFRGTYDGNGKKLANYTIQSSATSVGLIGAASCAHVTRVAATNGNVTATGNGSAALILGGDFGEIDNCYATGTVRGTTNVGGVSGGTHTIMDCYSAATVTATGSAGGIDGTGGSDIGVNDSFSASNISGQSADDAIVANSHNGSSTDCFYDSTKMCAGCSNASGAMAISTPSYFYAASNPPFTAWDFDNVWVANPNGYPTLQ